MSRKSHNIDFVVDTKPMAQEVSQVSRRVEATTDAVVAMKVAVVAAEVEGANHVCKNVNRGFFALMHSQISQKIAAKKSRAEALLIELNAQKKRLLEIQSTMERDYQRITARYTRFITGINRALEQRVHDLDRPIFNFCEREISTMSNREDLLIATVPVCQLENISASQQILASNIKYDSLSVINSTHSFLAQMNEQKLITNKILLTSVSAKDAEQVVPAVVSMSTIDRQGNCSLKVNVPDMLSDSNKTLIQNEIYSSEQGFDWKDKGLDERVSQEFMQLVADSKVSERVKNTASKLFAASSIQNF